MSKSNNVQWLDLWLFWAKSCFGEAVFRFLSQRVYLRIFFSVLKYSLCFLSFPDLVPYQKCLYPKRWCRDIIRNWCSWRNSFIVPAPDFMYVLVIFLGCLSITFRQSLRHAVSLYTNYPLPELKQKRRNRSLWEPLGYNYYSYLTNYINLKQNH